MEWVWGNREVHPACDACRPRTPEGFGSDPLCSGGWLAQNVAVSEAPTPTSSSAAALVPFIPRLTLEWLRDEPQASWREVEGTVAFIDISGFTAMSERLSSKGRAGAEEVTEVMNATFAALLGVAYAQGGGLLKFGGDALLLLYEGEDHARRAARAAFEMRRTLRVIGRPRTSAGAVQLKMHAGLHAGRCRLTSASTSSYTRETSWHTHSRSDASSTACRRSSSISHCNHTPRPRILQVTAAVPPARAESGSSPYG